MGEISCIDGTDKKGLANKGSRIQGEEIQVDDRSEVIAVHCLSPPNVTVKPAAEKEVR